MSPVPVDPDGQALPDGRRCPDCGGPIERLHRRALDRWASVFRSVHRYRCLDAACGWEGLVGRLRPEPSSADRPPARIARRLWWWTLGATLAGALAALAPHAFQRVRVPAATADGAVNGASANAPARLAAPGLDVEGVVLAPTDTRVATNPSSLTLRRHCAWGTPGGNRYRGTVLQALQAAHLPPEVVRQIADMASQGRPPDEVLITRDRVSTVDGRRRFSPRLRAMGFGNTLCFETQVNFVAGHVERGALYQVHDAQGRTHTVMVPYVCNNVAVLGEEADEDAPPAPPAPPAPQAPQPPQTSPAPAPPVTPAPPASPASPVPPARRVPEPATWSIALLALGVMAALHHSRRRSREASNGRRPGHVLGVPVSAPASAHARPVEPHPVPLGRSAAAPAGKTAPARRPHLLIRRRQPGRPSR